MSKILDLVTFYLRIESWLFKIYVRRKKYLLTLLITKGDKMKKFITLTFVSLFFSINLFAGCMKGEIKQIDAKLENSSISEDKKNEVMKLRKLVVANEHKNSELAFESYEKAMSILN